MKRITAQNHAPWGISPDAEYSLDELVEAANALLPRHLPAAPNGDARLRELVNARLVRHLATLGLIDEPLRQGREARYQSRHLLQLLTTRRLMAEGYTTGAVKKLLSGADDARLEALLLGESTPGRQDAPLQTFAQSVRDPDENINRAPGTPASPNSALAFLQKAQARSGQPKSRSVQPSVAAPPSHFVPAQRSTVGSTPEVSIWQHIRLSENLEIQVREDFRFPPTLHEREQLLQVIEEALRNLPVTRRKK